MLCKQCHVHLIHQITQWSRYSVSTVHLKMSSRHIGLSWGHSIKVSLSFCLWSAHYTVPQKPKHSGTNWQLTLIESESKQQHLCKTEIQVPLKHQYHPCPVVGINSFPAMQKSVHIFPGAFLPLANAALAWQGRARQPAATTLWLIRHHSWTVHRPGRSLSILRWGDLWPLGSAAL